jgi:hypothetical protein
MVGQHEERESERAVRRSAVATSRWLSRRGLPESESSRRLGLSRQTLLRWRSSWGEDHLASRPVGRPAERPEPWHRNLVLEVLWTFGPSITEESLQRIFPTIARAELRELRWRWRTVGRRRYKKPVASLRWLKPGRVWALDFTHPPAPVDGTYPYVLVARDLASGKLLLALSTPACDARTVIDALEALFLEHGPPLLIKWDNGSAFIAEETREYLEAHGVQPLYSPPGLPAYNGSCEAGIGGLKNRAHLEAARQDRPGEWTCDDVEAARQLGNETARPRGLRGPTPNEAWSRRTTITTHERKRLREIVEQERRREWAAQGLLLPFALSNKEQDEIDRVAVAHALVRCDLLMVRRRRIPQRVFEPNCLVVSS